MSPSGTRGGKVRTRAGRPLARVELSLFADSRMYTELLAEATLRNRSVAEHIEDLLIKRDAVRHGSDYDGASWLPGQGAQAAPGATKAAEPVIEPEDKGAAASAGVWRNRLKPK